MYRNTWHRYGPIMKTLELSEDDMVLLRNALLSYLSAFSHDEAGVITHTQQTPARGRPGPAPGSRTVT
jgi:hypothetical protein